MTEDERDWNTLVASILPDHATPRDAGLAALRRLFERWHREAHEPGAGQQRK